MAEQRGELTINIYLIYLQVYKWVKSVAVWSHIKKIVDQCSGYNSHQSISHFAIKVDSCWWPIVFYSTAELTYNHLIFILLICRSQLVFILILVPMDQISRLCWFMVFNATFNNISVRGRENQTCRKSLTNFITYCWIEYTSPWTGLGTHNVSGDRHRLHR